MSSVKVAKLQSLLMVAKRDYTSSRQYNKELMLTVDRLNGELDALADDYGRLATVVKALQQALDAALGIAQ